MVRYDWNRYAAIHEGESLFSRRYAAFQHAAGRIAGTLLGDTTGPLRGVEFGTGTGGTTRHLLDALPHLELLCLEPDTAALTTAESALLGYAGRVDLLQEDFLASDHRDADLVAGLFVVHNFPDEVKRRFYRKARQTLRPGGVLIIGDVMTYDDPADNQFEWQHDDEMIAALPPADHAYWKDHFTRFDKPFSSPLSWNTAAMRRAGLHATEAKYRDGFWTIVTARG